MTALIGITAGEAVNNDYPWSPLIYGQSRLYSDAVILAKGVPLIFPLTTDGSTLRAMYDSVGGIIIAGGNDINPALYGQEPHEATQDISTYRDLYETQLIKWALADQRPILGICRGMQLLNAVCGGSLYQHIPDSFAGAEDHRSSNIAEDVEYIAHTIKLKHLSKLAAILGTSTIKTNSSHHQAINLIASNLRAVAWADDGIIEAVESTDNSFVIGIQSHPESLVAKAETTWLKLFESFVQSSTPK